VTNGEEEREPAAAPQPPHPILNAMLLCDLTVREEGTGKYTLVGIFENINARAFPYRHGSLSVYAKITDAQGDYSIGLQFVRLEDLQVIGEGNLSATIPDRNAVSELVFQLGGLAFERPGRYEFRLLANGRAVGIKTFNVLHLA
jgi:hypothetical protein